MCNHVFNVFSSESVKPSNVDDELNLGADGEYTHTHTVIWNVNTLIYTYCTLFTLEHISFVFQGQNIISFHKLSNISNI